MLNSAYKKFAKQQCIVERNSFRRVFYHYNSEEVIDIHIYKKALTVNLTIIRGVSLKSVLFDSSGTLDYFKISLQATLYRSMRRLYWTDHI